jgi:hypothetical protein
MAIPTEESEQFDLVAWLDQLASTVPDLLYFAIPNGGWRPRVKAAKLRQAGVKAGVPDLFIPTPRSGYHGLFIELKRIKGGYTSYEQRQWLQWLQANGYMAQVCPGATIAKTVISKYLGCSA